MGREKRSHVGINSFKLIPGGFSLEFTLLRSALKTHILPPLLYIIFPPVTPAKSDDEKHKSVNAATVGGSWEL